MSPTVWGCVAVRFLGEEVVTTAAGRFDCRHYQFLFDDWPAIDY
jgi:hypothetical protein